MTALSIFSEEHPAYPLLITTNVILTSFLATCASVSTIIADGSIQGELGFSNTETLWLTTLNFLGVNLTVPAANWLATHFGFKRVYTYGVIIFVIGSFLAAWVSGFFLFASARVIQGIGTGLIFPVGLALIIQSLPKSMIGLGVSIYIGVIFGCGIGIGLPLVGYFTQFSSWRDMFALMASISAVAAIPCWISRPKTASTIREPFDLFGYLTFMIFLCTFLIALTMAPIRATAAGWREPYIVIFLIIAAISFIACIFAEKRHPNPIFPLILFKNPIFSVSLAALFLLGMATFASIAVSVNYMLHSLFYEKFVVGKIAAIYGILVGVVSILSNYLTKFVPIPILTFTGLCLLSLSYFYNNELNWLTGYTQVSHILILRGISIGLALGPTTLLALQGIPTPLKSSAATVLTFFRQVGGTYGTTLIAIFSIRQTIFHTARFGEQINTQLPAYKMTFKHLYDKFPDAALAKATIIQNVKNQAYIQGLNDSLIVFGYVTVAVTFILMILIGIRMLRKQTNN